MHLKTLLKGTQYMETYQSNLPSSYYTKPEVQFANAPYTSQNNFASAMNFHVDIARSNFNGYTTSAKDGSNNYLRSLNYENSLSQPMQSNSYALNFNNASNIQYVHMTFNSSAIIMQPKTTQQTMPITEMYSYRNYSSSVADPLHAIPSAPCSEVNIYTGLSYKVASDYNSAPYTGNACGRISSTLTSDFVPPNGLPSLNCGPNSTMYMAEPDQSSYVGNSARGQIETNISKTANIN